MLRSRCEEFRLRGQGIGAGQVAGAHAALDVVGQLLQVLALGGGLNELYWQCREQPGGFAQLPDEAKARHLFRRLGLGCGRLGGSRAGGALAGQPQGHGDADLGFAAAGIAL